MAVSSSEIVACLVGAGAATALYIGGFFMARSWFRRDLPQATSPVERRPLAPENQPDDPESVQYRTDTRAKGDIRYVGEPGTSAPAPATHRPVILIPPGWMAEPEPSLIGGLESIAHELRRKHGEVGPEGEWIPVEPHNPANPTKPPTSPT